MIRITVLLLITGCLLDCGCTAANCDRQVAGVGSGAKRADNGSIVAAPRADGESDAIRKERAAAGWALKLLQSTNEFDVVNGANQLGRSAFAFPEAVPILIKTLDSTNWMVCGAAIRALGQYGSAAKGAVPGIVGKLGTMSVQHNAQEALVKIGPSSVPALTAALASADNAVRWGAAGALRMLGPTANAAVPALTNALARALADDDHTVQCEVARALGAMRGDAAGALPMLREMMLTEHDYADSRVCAAGAVGCIAPDDPDFMPVILAALQDKLGVSYRMGDVICDLGPSAKPAIPYLVKVLEDKDPLVREAAAEALRKIQPSR